MSIVFDAAYSNSPGCNVTWVSFPEGTVTYWDWVLGPGFWTWDVTNPNKNATLRRPV
jgi:hypothetical protein